MDIIRELVDDIKKGGRIYTPKGMGKTTSAIQAMKEDNNLYYTSPHSDNIITLRNSFPDIRKRLLLSFGASRLTRKRGKNIKIIVDESDYAKEFGYLPNILNIAWCLISSVEERLVVYSKERNRIELNKTDN